jgi:hypothetical protein
MATGADCSVDEKAARPRVFIRNRELVSKRLIFKTTNTSSCDEL